MVKIHHIVYSAGTGAAAGLKAETTGSVDDTVSGLADGSMVDVYQSVLGYVRSRIALNYIDENVAYSAPRVHAF